MTAREDLELVKQYFSAPFKPTGCELIMSQGINGETIFAMVRGHGYLTGTGGHNLSEEDSCKVQDSMERVIVEALNQYFNKTP
jgi:hypothetical protein